MKRSRSKISCGPRTGVGAWFTALLVACLVFASGVSATPRASLRGHSPGDAAGQAGSGFVQSSGSLAAPTARPGSGPRKNPNIVIDPNLARQLSAGGSRDFAIEFVERPDLSAAYSMDWQARGRFVFERLKAAAERSQEKVIDLLQRRGERFDSFVVKNVILVRGGSYQTMESLLSFDEIKRISIPPKMGLILPERFASPDPRVPSGKALANPKVVGTNIEWVQADEVWAQGITGVGAVVGVIDSGVRFDHEALVTQYRGNQGGGSFNHNFNWLDPEGGSPFPAPASSDINDQHGTHVAGTMVGDDFDSNPANRDQVGMAPGAKWIACQGFPAAGSVDAALLGCGDFMLAPTDLTGGNPDPDLRPMAVNNSWGACTAGVVDDFYTDVVDSWNAAGVIPVFAAGNASNCGYSAPPGLGTVGSPGAYPTVFTIGSTGNANGIYASHSNWGPTEGINTGLPNFPDANGFPQLKPNVVAPGVNVRSTIGTGTATYDSAGWTGTSMSTPHVTGLMALMFEAADCLVGDFGRVGTIIQQTARPIDYASGTEGGAAPPGPNNLPNYATGWGEIDAPDAVQAAIEECGPQAFISGSVTETGSGLPIPGALVEIFVDEMVRVYTTTTDASGNYTRRVPVPDVPDTYTVRVTRYGFVGESVSGVVVLEEQTTTEDFVLDAAAEFTVSGIVRDSATGWPLHAQLDIAGFPDSPIWSDPVTGAYTVELAEGIEFAITVTPTVGGYVAEAANVGPLVAPLNQDFAVDANLTACAAPGYQLGAPVLTEDFEVAAGATTPPAGWSISTLGGGTTPGWRFGTAQGSTFFPIPAHTRYAAANEDDTSNTNSSEDYLITPVINLSAAASPILRFDSRLSGEFDSTGQVQGSTDGGTTWTVVVGNAPANGRTGPWTTQTMSLAALAGEANVRLRFHHDDNGFWADGWAVDDISVTPGCVAPVSGGLVTGRVVDENTGQGLNGALVTTNGGEDATTIATADPAVGAGFYAVFAAPGAVDVDAAPGASQPSGYGTDSDTVVIVDEQNTALDLELPAAQLTVTPAGGPSATVQLGQNSTQPFSVGNQGGLPADYQIVLAGVVEDFEGASFPPAGWSVIDNGSGCPWDTNVAYGLPNYAGGQGLSATVSSDACGSGTVADASLVSPPFSLEFSTQASLDFVLSYRHLGSSRFDVDFSSDNGATWTTIFSQTSSTSATGPGTPVSIDLADQLGAAEARLRLRYRAGWDWWVLVDQLRLFADANSVAWLGIAPTSGSLGVGPTSQAHNAVFRGSQVDQPGFFQVPLQLVESTPYPAPALDASMTVTAPASFGTLSGTVRGLGYCDADPAPIEGATVIIQGGSAVYQTITDANGEYSWQLDSGQAPLSVSVSAADHISGEASGVMLSAGGTATANVDLRAALPCFDALESNVSATLQSGDTASDLLTLVNSGAGAVDPWMIQIGGDPTTPLSRSISQSVDGNTILSPNSVACPTGPNGFYRVYNPADEGFVGNVSVQSVRFGVETVQGAREVEIGLYALVGPILNPTDIIQLAPFEVLTLPVGTNYFQTVTLANPVIVPAGTQLLVEVWTAAGNAAGAQFFPGGNDGGESAPSYIIADACGASFLTPFADLGFPEVQLIIDLGVVGAKVCGAGVTPVDWLSVDPTDGSIAADSNVAVDADFNAAGKSAGSYGGALCLSAADPQNGASVVPATMEVVTSVPDIDVAVAVTESADPVQAGTDLDYAVDVSNAGPSAATNVEVDASLAAGLAYDGFSGTDWSCTEVGGAVNCTYAGGLAAAASAPTLSILTTPLSAGDATSDFVVTATGDDLDAGNNLASVTTTVTPAPDVDMALNADVEPSTVVQGNDVRLRLISANVGSDEATGVEIAIALPEDLSYVGATGTGWSCVAVASDVTCTQSASVASGFAPTLDVMLSTSAGFGAVQIESVVTSSEADGNVGNNTATVDLTVTPASDDIFDDGFESPPET